MDSRAIVGLAFIALIGVLLAGSHSARMPTRPEISARNADAALHEVRLVRSKDGGTVQGWKLEIDPGRTRSVQCPVHIGSFRLSASMQGSGNATSDFVVPSRFLDRARSETFTITGAGLFRGNIY